MAAESAVKFSVAHAHDDRVAGRRAERPGGRVRHHRVDPADAERAERHDGQPLRRPARREHRAAERDLVQLAHRVGDGDAPVRHALPQGVGGTGGPRGERPELRRVNADDRGVAAVDLHPDRFDPLGRDHARQPRHGGKQPAGQRERRDDEQVRLDRAAQRGDRRLPRPGRADGRHRRVRQRPGAGPERQRHPGDDGRVPGRRPDALGSASRPWAARSLSGAPLSTATSTPVSVPSTASAPTPAGSIRRQPPCLVARALRRTTPVRRTEPPDHRKRP